MVSSRTRALTGWLALAVTVASGAAQEDRADDDPLLGSASELRIENGAEDLVAIEAGARLYQQPHLHAPVVTVIDVEVALRPLERRGDWVKVGFAERIGWAYCGPPLPTAEPPPERPEPPAPPEPFTGKLTADADRLERAVSFLSGAPGPVEVPPFRLYTDLTGKRTRQLALDAARNLAAAYSERYGLAPQREASFAVVIFAHEPSYRDFENSVADLYELDAQGHAGSGVAALSAAGRTPSEVAALLIHELTHLLNRRTFAASPPPWLEEGIANDLAYCRLDRAARLQLATLSGRSFVAEVPGPSDIFGRRRFSGTFHIQGPIASLSQLKRRVSADESVPLPELVDLTWPEFVDPEGRELRYIQSTFFVRYLLDEVDRDRFRSFLAAYQVGGSADGTALLAAMAADWETLARGFREWIMSHPDRG